MIEVYAESFVRAGSDKVNSGKPCEDYASHTLIHQNDEIGGGDVYVGAVADGCSTAMNTSLGANLLVNKFFDEVREYHHTNGIHNYNNNPEKFKNIHRLMEFLIHGAICEIIGSRTLTSGKIVGDDFPYELYCSIQFYIYFNGYLHVMSLGDGGACQLESSGEAVIYKKNFEKNIPYYPVYKWLAVNKPKDFLGIVYPDEPERSAELEIQYGKFLVKKEDRKNKFTMKMEARSFMSYKSIQNACSMETDYWYTEVKGGERVILFTDGFHHFNMSDFLSRNPDVAERVDFTNNDELILSIMNPAIDSEGKYLRATNHIFNRSAKGLANFAGDDMGYTIVEFIKDE